MVPGDVQRVSGRPCAALGLPLTRRGGSADTALLTLLGAQLQFVPGTNSFVPRPAIQSRSADQWRTDRTGNGGLFVDDDATWYDRSHHRLLIPNVTDTPRQNDVWCVRACRVQGLGRAAG